jgi:hypothetical protein
VLEASCKDVHTVVDVTACVVDVAGGVASALLDNVCRYRAGAVRLCCTAGSFAVSHCMLESAATARSIGQYPGLRAGTDAGARAIVLRLAGSGLSRS